MIRWLAAAALLVTSPVAAKESLGVFSDWATFRDAETPRCYAIAQYTTDEDETGYVTVGTWPELDVRGQVHVRLSRETMPGARVRMRIGNRRFDLKSEGQKAWAKDNGMDAAIIAAMRSATSMRVSSIATNGRAFTDRYTLEGAATAMDAALIGCASSNN
ncbi:MAG: invasion associated locus B family protein [Pseudomonadota bacterium]